MSPDTTSTDTTSRQAGRWKRPLLWVGGLLFLLSVVFLGRQILLYRAELGATLARPAVAAATACGAAIYALLLILLARAWTLVAARGLPLAERQTLVGIDGLHAYALSGIYKYLPGNFLHFVSRQALFRHGGAGQWQLARASLAEVLLQLAAAATIGGAALLGTCAKVACSAFSWFDLHVPPGLLGMGLLAAALAGLLGAASQLPTRELARAAALNLGFFLGFAAILAGLFTLLGAGQPASLARLVGAYLIAWLIGFLTPGAPGGLGIREAAFLVLAGDSGAIALEGALLGRLVSTAGDLLFPLLTGSLKTLAGRRA